MNTENTENKSATPPVLTKSELRQQRLAKKRLELAEKQLLAEKQYVRDHLKREINFTSKTYQKASDDWNSMICQIKTPEFKQDLEATWAEFNQTLDRKANVIERLKKNRQTAADQFKISAHGHHDFICYAKKLFHLLAKSMRDIYEHDVEQMLEEFRSECIFRKRIGERRKSNYEHIIHGTNVLTLNAIDHMEKKFLFEKEDSSNHNIECREKLRLSICTSMNKLFQQIQNVCRIIQENSMTDERVKLYELAEAREQFDAKQIDSIRNSSKRCTEEIDALAQKLIDIENENLMKISDYKYEKKYFSDCFQIMREQYNGDMKRDTIALRYLVENANGTISVLKQNVEKGEHILSILSVCRKLQTEREKVVAIDGDEHDDQIGTAYDDELNHLPHLELFWKKVGKIKEQNLALKEEKSVLEKENEKLQNMIRHYCSQQSYARAIDSLKIPLKATVKEVPVQEASHMDQLRRKMNERPFY